MIPKKTSSKIRIWHTYTIISLADNHKHSCIRHSWIFWAGGEEKESPSKKKKTKNKFTKYMMIIIIIVIIVMIVYSKQKHFWRDKQKVNHRMDTYEPLSQTIIKLQITLLWCCCPHLCMSVLLCYEMKWETAVHFTWHNRQKKSSYQTQVKGVKSLSLSAYVLVCKCEH